MGNPWDLTQLHRKLRERLSECSVPDCPDPPGHLRAVRCTKESYRYIETNYWHLCRRHNFVFEMRGAESFSELFGLLEEYLALLNELGERDG